MSSVSASLKTVDSLVVDVITDDVSDSFVSKTMFAVSEFANIVKAGAACLSGDTLLEANIGYGLRLTTSLDGMHHCMLFDSGPSESVFLRNCARLGISLGAIEAIAISHGHFDHMGALPSAIPEIVKLGGNVTVHVNPDMFVETGILLKDGTFVPFADVISKQEMERLGAKVDNDPDQRVFLDSHYYYSGEIPRVTTYEKGRSDHLRRRGKNANWQPDPLLMDERLLVVNVADLGLVVFTACSHAGIVNVCTHVNALFPEIPIHCVMGGLHLGGVMEPLIPASVEGLKEFEIAHIIAGHCTGWRALHALAQAFGDKVSQSAVGTTYTFRAEPQPRAGLDAAARK